MSPKYEQQHDSLRPQSGFRSTHTGEHKRNSSMTSQGHRHEPYKSASRQSSISSLSGVVQGSDGASSDWQWESSAEPEAFSSSSLSNAGLSICPADLQVKPAARQPQRSTTFFAPQTPLRNPDYADDGDDSDVAVDLKPEGPHSRKPRANIPAPIMPTTPGARSKIQLATATTTWSRSSGATRTSRDSKPQKHYREDSAVPDSPILVTAITSSGKKSHARKVSQGLCHCPHLLITRMSTATGKPYSSPSKCVHLVSKARRGFQAYPARGGNQTSKHFRGRRQDVGRSE